MPSITEATKDVDDSWVLNQRQRSIFFSMLDDSDDDSPVIKEVESARDALQAQVDRVTRKRNPLARATQRIQRDDSHPAIRRRDVLRQQIDSGTNVYTLTSNLRAKEAETSSVTRYAFNTSALQEAPSPSSANIDHPQFTWLLRFKLLQIPNISSSDIWTELNYDEQSFQVWWRRRYADQVPSESDGWSDVKRLARRVTMQILEQITLLQCPHTKHLKMVAERSREIVLYQIILCFNLPPDGVEELQEIFEFTVPIIYLVSSVMRVSLNVPPNGIAESYRIEKRLQKLDPYVRDLRKKCYLLGTEIGFDIYQYKDEFGKGAIFDFDEESFGKDEIISLDHRIAGANGDEYIKRIDNIGQKQVLISKNAQNRDFWEDFVSDVGYAVKLEAKVLKEIGLRELTDVIYDSQKWKGSGGYADIYGMERTDNSKPVAVKAIRPGPKSAKRIEREARIWIKIKHKHIAPLLGFVCFDSLLSGQPCLVSELYHTDLRHLVKEHGRNSSGTKAMALTEERRLTFLRDIVFALDHLHVMHIAHGDLRAANVLVTNELLDDPSCYAVLNDFGMSEYDDNGICPILDGRDLSSVNQRTSEYWLAPELFEKSSRIGSLSRVSKAGDV